MQVTAAVVAFADAPCDLRPHLAAPVLAARVELAWSATADGGPWTVELRPGRGHAPVEFVASQPSAVVWLGAGHFGRVTDPALAVAITSQTVGTALKGHADATFYAEDPALPLRAIASCQAQGYAGAAGAEVGQASCADERAYAGPDHWLRSARVEVQWSGQVPAGGQLVISKAGTPIATRPWGPSPIVVELASLPADPVAKWTFALVAPANAAVAFTATARYYESPQPPQA